VFHLHYLYRYLYRYRSSYYFHSHLIEYFLCWLQFQFQFISFQFQYEYCIYIAGVWNVLELVHKYLDITTFICKPLLLCVVQFSVLSLYLSLSHTHTHNQLATCTWTLHASALHLIRAWLITPITSTHIDQRILPQIEAVKLLMRQFLKANDKISAQL